MYKYFPSLLVPYEWVLKESEQLAESSHELMKVQYDLPEELFDLMLRESELIYPKYTMALWEKGASNILEAQKDMLDDAIKKVGIKDGDNILDLGCGFGASCHYILTKFPNAKVTGLNLSHTQCEYMRKKMQDPNITLSSDRFTLIEQDFNEAIFETKFDKVIAIGLLEHIGNLTNALAKITSFLKDNGRVFIHITSARLLHNMYDPFINKYIFPRARIWHFEQIPLRNQKLKTVNKWFMNGSNYAQTLRSWLKDFDVNQNKIKTLNYGMDYGQFRRMWRLYLLWYIAYFEACNGEVLGNGQYLLVPNSQFGDKAMSQYYETIIVGGGPAGSSCAWKLKKQGKEVLVLDKASFPRLKLCAGWITSKVMEKLEFTPEDYPHSILKMKAQMYIAPIPFPVLTSWAMPWRKDYSIRRIEFDIGC